MPNQQTVADELRTALMRQLAPCQPWLCMVSGGSDSTALAYLAAEATKEAQVGPLAFFTMNHRLRGAAADEDAAFVKRLSDLAGVELFAVSVDVAAEVKRTGENLEAAARRMRYEQAEAALDAWCSRQGRDAAEGLLMTAHTLDDRIENFLMRVIVGTGPGGFRGMDRRRGRLRRPLIDVERATLRSYMRQRAEAGLPVVYADEAQSLWREDATNADRGRLRAFVRHDLAPLLKTRNPSLPSTLRRTMDLIADEDDYMRAQAARAQREHLTWSDPAAPTAGFRLAPAFGALPRAVARRVIHEALALMAGDDARVDARAVEAVLNAFADGRPISGYVCNIQGNLAVSANKRGVLVEPMSAFRARRKRKDS